MVEPLKDCWEFRVVKFVYDPEEIGEPEYTIAKHNTETGELIFDWEMVCPTKDNLLINTSLLVGAFLKEEVIHIIKA